MKIADIDINLLPIGMFLAWEMIAMRRYRGGLGFGAAAKASVRAGRRLAARVTLGVGSYFATLWLLRRALLIEVADLVREQLGNGRQAA
jgi:hypothetical protein